MLNVVKKKIHETSAYNKIGHYFAQRRGRLFDKEFNVETAIEVELKYLDIDSPNVEFGGAYSGSDPKSFRPLINNLDFNYQDLTFIDLGSGKGRVLFMAAEFPFKRIIGVEFSSELNEIAQQNIARYKNPQRKCFDIQSVNQDASLFVPPNEPLVIYMFNPFEGNLIAKVFRNIEKSFTENPREIHVIYGYPLHKSVFDNSKIFKEYYTDDWYSVYKTTSAIV